MVNFDVREFWAAWLKNPIYKQRKDFLVTVNLFSYFPPKTIIALDLASDIVLKEDPSAVRGEGKLQTVILSLGMEKNNCPWGWMKIIVSGDG